MKIGVIGTGHVGLITCVTLSAKGHEVIGNDSDEEKVEMLRRGVSPFFEPGLQEMLEEQLAAGLRFTTSTKEAVEDAEVVFLTVGTPPTATGEANLIAVESAATEVARHALRSTVVVEKSTVPAGTAARVKRTVQRMRPKDLPELEVASNPEFLREGKAIEDNLKPDRILVGVESDHARKALREVYRPWLDEGYAYIETDIATAELSKHACNAFLAMKISYVNALARLCERAGADVTQVAEVMGSDPRIGRAFLDAGLGYGGFCFPKDIQAFERLSHRLGYDFGLLREVARVNVEAVDAAFDKVVDALWNLEGKRVLLLGLAFKPNTDDVRLSPALALAERLMTNGADVVGYDPQAANEAKAELPTLEILADLDGAFNNTHAVVLCTEWSEFRDIDWKTAGERMVHPVLVDARNLLDPAEMVEAGFAYYAMGRRDAG